MSLCPAVPAALFRKTALIILPLTGLLAPAQIFLRASTTTVVSGNQCELKVHGPQGAPGTLAYSVVEAGGGAIHTAADGRTFYTAPAVLNLTTFRLRAMETACLGATAELSIHVTPRIQGVPDLLAETLLPELMGPDWMVPAPRMTLFAGYATGNPAPDQVIFNWVAAISFVDADPAMGDLNNQWLVGDNDGLKVVSGQGKAEVLPGLPRRVTAIAARPKGSAPANPFHVVFAQSLPGTRSYLGNGRISGPAGVIWTLAPDGTAQVLAGNRWNDPSEARYRDGDALEARFGYISALTMNAGGDLFIADTGNNLIRKLTPAGQVTTVAGRVDAGVPLFLSYPFNLCLASDGQGEAGGFGHIRGMALDQATGDLYVVDGHAIRKVTPAGEVATVLGLCAQTGFEAGPSDQPVPLGTPCLSDPDGLHLRGDNLFIADSSNNAIRVFNLTARTLQTVVGHRTQPLFRAGPMGRFSDLPPAGCAALSYPGTLGISAGGSCLVDLPHGLAHLDLHTLALTEPLEPAPAQTD